MEYINENYELGDVKSWDLLQKLKRHAVGYLCGIDHPLLSFTKERGYVPDFGPYRTGDEVSELLGRVPDQLRPNWSRAERQRIKRLLNQLKREFPAYAAIRTASLALATALDDNGNCLMN